jgi:hypothetical protein
MDFLTEAPNLYRRYQQVDAYRRYVKQRLPLVVPVIVVFLAISLATTSGAVVYIGGRHALVVLLAMVLAPFFLLGSFAVQLFLFFAWIERRAMQRLSGARKLTLTPREQLNAVPWAFAGVFLGVPFLALALLTFKVASVLLLLGVLAPAAFYLLDR